MSDRIEYSDEIADAICEWVADGKSLRSFCRQKGSPNKSSVLRWAESNQEFATKYARARDIGIDERFEAMDEELSAESDTQRARLLFDTRKWQLSKLCPKKYGDKVQQELSGPDGGAIELKNMSPDALEDEIRRLSAKVGLGDPS